MKSSKKISVGIYGAAGFVAGKLLQLLSNHPYAEVSRLVSDTYTGQGVEAAHPALRDIYDLTFTAYSPTDFVESCDIIFLTKPHGQSLGIAGNLVDMGAKVIDLSADYRMKDPKIYEKWYGTKHTDLSHLSESVYGLPELHARDIVGAKLVANPGCYPTCVVLALAPAVSLGLVDSTDISVCAVSGASGAGRTSQDTQYLNVESNLRPYKIGIHPHTPEMEQELSILCKGQARICFVPLIASFKYGIMATIHTNLIKDTEMKELLEIYNQFYKDMKFVRVLDKALPQLLDVVDTNFCDISVTIDEHTGRCVINSAIDNAVKGASGQAIQNMNLMFGFDETTGLPYGERLKSYHKIKL